MKVKKSLLGLSVFCAIAFMGLSLFMLHSGARTHEEYMAKIALATRQKALADEIGKHFLLIPEKKMVNQEVAMELEKFKLISEKFTNAQKALVTGSEMFGIQKENSTEAQSMLQLISGQFVAIRDGALELSTSGGALPMEKAMSIQPIIDEYNDGINQVIGQYMSESTSAFDRIQTIGLLSGLLAFAGFFFAYRFSFRPMRKSIEGLNETMQKLEEEVGKANKAKTEFLANMSHEIRTPLNGVVGMTELLSKTSLNEEQRGYVKNVHGSALNLLDVVNDILDFSQLEAGKFEISPEKFSLSDCFEQVVELMRPLAHNKKLELLSDIDPEIPTELFQDERRLRQILLNLIGNAIKFTDKGEILIKADLMNSSAGFAQIKFLVRDTGIGISEEHKRNLFESFSQADSSINRKYGGSGLGLAISKQLVSELGGRIWLESEANKGSSFYFTFVAEISGQSQQAKINALQGLKALVVDDNKTNLKILVKQLSAWGIQATPFNSPDLVTDILANLSRFDFCIMDMQMPEMDGGALAERIRLNLSTEELPIIVLSSVGKHLIDHKGHLYNAYLTKPVRQARLLDTIIEVMNLEASVFAKEKMIRGNYEVPSSLKNMKVLIAQDNDLHRAVSAKTLQLMGYAFDSAKSGTEVLERSRKNDYDMIIMDLELPGMNGVETVKRLKRLTGKNDLPIILGISEKGEEAEKLQGIQAGMDEVITEPVDVDALQTKIVYWLQSERE
jgi:signal transduction histidine kinase/CheY-like chemotaxis protein